MFVLCAIGLRNGPQMVRRLLEVIGRSQHLVLLHVIDVEPRQDLAHLAGPLRQGPLGGSARQREMSEAEQTAGSQILAETLREIQRAGVTATTRLEKGIPERTIVAVAREVGASVVAICARELPAPHPLQGPASIGHTARFVIDHAPCDVVLLRLAM